MKHTPVMLEEAIDLLKIQPGGVYLDGTLGMGGHSEEILRRLDGTGRLIAVDRDSEALDEARRRLAPHSNFQAFHENFKNLPLILQRLGIDRVDGCLLDLGVSSLQLDDAGRGFSFRQDGPLDMRMDQETGTTAAQIVNAASTNELIRIFKEHGEEPQARRIAEAIVQQRATAPIRRTAELAQLIADVKGRGGRRRRIHPATQAFQALRIEVNRELEGLTNLLESLIERLTMGGRLAVISFHSLEDRVVKRTFRLQAGHCICFRPPQVCRCPRQRRVEILTRRPLSAGEHEQESNPRARSARLRAVERVEASSPPSPKES